MNRITNRRGRIGSLLAMALGAIALLAMPAMAAAKDHNHDRIPDRWEKRHHLSLTVNQAHHDQDGDHLQNLGEFRAGDNPRDEDSDDDGIVDGQENAGTIASFDATTGKLTIDLFGTDTITGLVTDQTEIKCEGAGSPVVSMSSHDSQGEEPGDDNGGQGEEAANGHGGQGEEPGDDNGGAGNSGSDSAGPGSSGQGDSGGSANCTASDLVPGAVVQQAELEIEHGTATFGEVELAG